MPGSWPPHLLPRLAGANHRITSPATRGYNCIAWAAGESHRNWWPDPMAVDYWPAGVPREITLNAFVVAYGLLGYRLTMNSTPEDGLEKIALYGTGPLGSEKPTHAALQLPGGQWTSKLGKAEDIEHAAAADLEGPAYGRVICYFSRPRPLPRLLP